MHMWVAKIQIEAMIAIYRSEREHQSQSNRIELLNKRSNIKEKAHKIVVVIVVLLLDYPKMPRRGKEERNQGCQQEVMMNRKK